MSFVPWLITLIGTIEIAALITVCYFFSQLVGNPDNNNDLSKTVMPISAGLGVIIIIHTLLWYMYFNFNAMAMNLYLLISGSFCMIISLTALSISLVQRA